MKITDRKRLAIGMLAATWFALTTFCASVEPARAATVFNLAGTFTDSSTVSGALTIDVVTGQVVAANLSYLGSTYSNILSQAPFSGETNLGQTPVPVSYFVAIGSSAALLPRIDLGIPGTSAVGSLISYMGGSLCSLDHLCGPDQAGLFWASDFRLVTPGQFVFLQTGELNAVPLPAALPLFAAGLGVIGLLGWRRKRRAVAVRRALTATVFVVGLSACANVAQATPVVFQLTLNQTFPDIETSQGTFSIDSAFLTPNTQINFINFLSFSVAIEGFHFTLSHALLPATEGVLTDASGAVVRFNDSATTILTEFCSAGTGSSSCPIFLVFHDGTSPPFIYSTSGGDSGGDTVGT